MVQVIVPKKSEGWFCFERIEVPLDVIKEHGKVLHDSDPDIFPVFSDQVIRALREIYNI